MAVTTTSRVAGPFLGNGVTVQFGFNFKVFAAADLLVVRADAEGNVSDAELGVDYTVALNSNQDVSAGGSVTMLVAPATGSLLVITSDVAELQQVILNNFGGFYPDVLNGVFDRLTIFVQQLQVTANRSLQFPVTDTTSPVLPSAAQRAEKVLYFDENGALIALSLASLSALLAPAGSFVNVSGIVFNEVNSLGVATGHTYVVQLLNGQLTWTQLT